MTTRTGNNVEGPSSLSGCRGESARALLLADVDLPLLHEVADYVLANPLPDRRVITFDDVPGATAWVVSELSGIDLYEIVTAGRDYLRLVGVDAESEAVADFQDLATLIVSQRVIDLLEQRGGRAELPDASDLPPRVNGEASPAIAS